MWKLLPVCLLVACAANDPHPSASDGNQRAQERIVRQFVAPLASSITAFPVSHQERASSDRGCRAGWMIAVPGIFGVKFSMGVFAAPLTRPVFSWAGWQACSSPEWLTDVDYPTSLMHCNSATRWHEGGGNL